MAYEKQNFVPGQKLKAEELNKMEQGIVDLESAIGSGGIYIGTEAPAGENVNVWIDTDEEVEGPKDGKDGVSPTVSVSDITGGHRITITDASGTKTVDVMDGKNGAAGVGIVSITITEVK